MRRNLPSVKRKISSYKLWNLNITIIILFKASTLSQADLFLASPEFKSSVTLCKIANWSVSCQLGFLTMLRLFDIFVSIVSVE